MSDLIKRLHTLAELTSGWNAGMNRSEVIKEAADRIEQLEREKAELRTAFHVNMLRLFPEKSHEEIASAIDGVIANPTIKDSLQAADQAQPPLNGEVE